MSSFASATNREKMKDDRHLRHRSRRTSCCLCFALSVFFFILAGILIALGIAFAFQVTSQINILKSELEYNQEKTERLMQKCMDGEKLSGNGSKHELPLNRLKRHREVWIGAHLVGKPGSYNKRRNYVEQAPNDGAYFEWDQTNVLAITDMGVGVGNIPPADGTYLEIYKDGFYFVYSQVTYNGFGNRVIGHETVKIYANGVVTVLMRYATSQKLASARLGIGNQNRSVDSGYHGGVFYLYREDKLAVKPGTLNSEDNKYKMDSAESFFGVIFLHE